MKNEFLHDWIFHFSPYTSLWYAFKREHSVAFFNGDRENVLHGPRIEDLYFYLVQNQGEIFEE